MSSLIEQAAHRLEQLRSAGIEVPEVLPREALGNRTSELAGMPPPNVGAVPPQATTGARSRPRPSAAAADDAALAGARRIDLDLVQLAAAGLVTPAAPRTLTADQYRVIKRPLLRNAARLGESSVAHGNLIMVTSAMAGEGKSFTSVNLALSIAAELDHTVMLVDADVARPSVLRMLGVEQAARGADGKIHGLLDVLEGRAALNDVILRTNVDKLSILPAGGFHERATELLASDAMRQLIDGVATRYPDRIVIFDSPPLLLTTEARVLATHMGQIVIVVHAEHTAQTAVANALATIESCPVRLLLLNQARGSTEGTYGYGYGYGERGPDSTNEVDGGGGASRASAAA